MNTIHKWNSYNDYTYQYYSEKSSVYKIVTEPEEQDEVVSKAEEYSTNFLNLPKDFQICR